MSAVDVTSSTLTDPNKSFAAKFILGLKAIPLRFDINAWKL